MQCGVNFQISSRKPEQAPAKHPLFQRKSFFGCTSTFADFGQVNKLETTLVFKPTNAV